MHTMVLPPSGKISIPAAQGKENTPVSYLVHADFHPCTVHCCTAGVDAGITSRHFMRLVKGNQVAFTINGSTISAFVSAAKSLAAAA
jgi:hypothetical protein